MTLNYHNLDATISDYAAAVYIALTGVDYSGVLRTGTA